MERLVADVPNDFTGAVINKLQARRADLLNMVPVGSRTKLEFMVPSRGLFGYRNEFLTDTKGEGIMASVFDHYEPMKGDIQRGPPAPGGLRDRRGGDLRPVQRPGAGHPVHRGRHPGVRRHDRGRDPKAEDITVNVCKKKQLTNMRASGSDEALRLTTPKQMSLEQCLEFLADDELLECTPENLRLRKRLLDHGDRMRRPPRRRVKFKF